MHCQLSPRVFFLIALIAATFSATVSHRGNPPVINSIRDPILSDEGGISFAQIHKKLNHETQKISLALHSMLTPDLTSKGVLHWHANVKEAVSQTGNFLEASFVYNKDKLTVKILHFPTDASNVDLLRLDHLKLAGIPKDPKPLAAYLNNKRWLSGDWHYNAVKKTLEAFDLDIPLTKYVALELRAGQDEEFVECPVSWDLRGSDGSISEDACLEGCVWDSAAGTCSLPPNSEYGYSVSGAPEDTTLGLRVPLSKLGASLYGDDIQDITFELTQYSDDILRLKFYDPNENRYEVPIELNLPNSDAKPANPLYSVVVTNDTGSPFSVQVLRAETGAVLFDTGIGGLTFANQLLTLSTRLPSENIYGLGEDSHTRFRQRLDQTTYPLFTRDESPPVQQRPINLYGVHPFYECIENDGNSHGVLILNSNAQEYQLSPSPSFTYRTIGGVLDIFIFLGPEPESVISQYTGVTGRPTFPPYWALGFQLSRWGYTNVEDVQTVVNRTRSCNVPQDVQYCDIDYMDGKGDFTYDTVNFAGLPEYVAQAREEGLRFVFILDPGIPTTREGYQPHQNALDADAYIRWPQDQNNGDYIYGNVWPAEDVGFPDFFKNSTRDWWVRELATLHDTLPYSGIWIDMNEPSNFNTDVARSGRNLQCPQSNLDNPPYLPRAGTMGPTNHIADKTLCMTSVQGDNGQYRHYDVHNLYGWSEAIATRRGVEEATGERSMVVSRSTFVSSGRYTTHWTGDNFSTWEQMRDSIAAILNFNLFGMPFVGADICGFNAETTEELCQRWMQLGAFYPFSRNHNTIGAREQDPCTWPETVGVASSESLALRYNLLPYLYTQLYLSHTEGTTVFRSMIHEFPGYRDFLDLDEQFLWGSAIVIAPILYEGATQVNVTLPGGTWYYGATGETFEGDQGAITVGPDQRLRTPLFFRGGYIIPVQAGVDALNTQVSRTNNFILLVMLGAEKTATGQLFWNDGESIGSVENGEYHLLNFSFAQNTFSTEILNSYPSVLDGIGISHLNIYGIETPTGLLVNGEASDNFTPDEGYLDVYAAQGETFSMTEPLTIELLYEGPATKKVEIGRRPNRGILSFH